MKLSKLSIVGISLTLIGAILLGIFVLVGGVNSLPNSSFSFPSLFPTFAGKSNQRTIEFVDKTFSSIDIDTSLAGFQIMTGDVEYPTLTYTELIQNDRVFYEVRTEINDATLKITDYFAEQKFTKRIGNLNSNLYKDNILVLPRDFKLSNLDIALDLGSLKVENIELENMNLVLDMGNAEIDNLIADYAEMKLDMGSVELSGGEIAGGKYTVSMGSMESSAKLTGEHIIDCDMGSIDLDIPLPESSVTYEIDVDMGNFNVNGDEVKLNNLKSDGDSIAHYIVNTSMGSVDFNFDK
ncbi:MAG: DUF4097 domain-containing protein [Clostridiaceae bacterium]|nr:DUF4097 domain-containing protein [Clostridiaceae bacterium]